MVISSRAKLIGLVVWFPGHDPGLDRIFSEYELVILSGHHEVRSNRLQFIIHFYYRFIGCSSPDHGLTVTRLHDPVGVIQYAAHVSLIAALILRILFLYAGTDSPLWGIPPSRPNGNKKPSAQELGAFQL